MANRLADAISPYLRSHANNPVDWWPWGPEAFTEAERRDVPVLVSIGYSTCHWCHVMARESFSDPGVAEYLNANFVSIKVDREEYPDVDASYMAAASAFTRNLGWPLNVFTTPTGLPFYAGTYFAPRTVNGVPEFARVLSAVAEAWGERRGEVTETAKAVAGALAASVRSMNESAAAGVNDQRIPNAAELESAVQALAVLEDPVFGGFGTPPEFNDPKFAVAPALGFLVRQAGTGSLLGARTLKLMGASPLRDPVEGGFFRYATRRDWGEPHYERMLYDNALLLDVAVRAWQNDPATNAWAATLSDALVRFLLTTLRVGDGAFASGQDSESLIDGVSSEGGYYALDAENRALQPSPALDAKILAGWNGLAIAALARAGAALHRSEWLEVAQGAADHIVGLHLRDAMAADATDTPLTLARASLGDRVSAAVATLEDYGMLAGGLLALAEATGEAGYAVTARALVDATVEAAASAGLASGRPLSMPLAMPFAVPGGADPVLVGQGIALEVDASEGAYPSGLSAIANAAYELWLLSGEQRYRDAAEKAVAFVGPSALERPLGYGAMLTLAARLHGPGAQLVSVVTGGAAAGADELLRVARAHAASVDLHVVVTEEQARAFADAGFELFSGRSAQGGVATSYLCQNMVCSLPVTDGAALAAELDRLKGV